MIAFVRAGVRSEIRDRARIGIAGGLVLTAYHLVNNLLNLAARPQAVLSWSLIVALLILYGWAGAREYQKVKSARAAAYAGLLVGLTSALISFATLMAITYGFMGIIRQNDLLLQDYARSQGGDLSTFIVQDALGGSAFLLGFGVLAGAGAGLLGAFARKVLRTR